MFEAYEHISVKFGWCLLLWASTFGRRALMDDLDAWLGTSLGPENLRAEVRQACGGSLEDLRSCELEDLESELSRSTWPPLERQRFLRAWRGLRGEHDVDEAAAAVDAAEGSAVEATSNASEAVAADREDAGDRAVAAAAGARAHAAGSCRTATATAVDALDKADALPAPVARTRRGIALSRVQCRIVGPAPTPQAVRTQSPYERPCSARSDRQTDRASCAIPRPESARRFPKGPAAAVGRGCACALISSLALRCLCGNR